MKYILLFWILIITSCCCWCAQQPYIVDNESIEPNEGEDGTLFDFSNLKCIGRSRAMNGTVIIKEDMEGAFTMSAIISSSSSGNSHFAKVATVPKTDICEGFKKFHRQFIQPALKHGENTNLPLVPDDGLCPIPKGEYFIKELFLETDQWPNQVPRGLLKVVISFHKDDKYVGGVTVLIKIQDR